MYFEWSNSVSITNFKVFFFFQALKKKHWTHSRQPAKGTKLISERVIVKFYHIFFYLVPARAIVFPMTLVIRPCHHKEQDEVCLLLLCIYLRTYIAYVWSSALCCDAWLWCKQTAQWHFLKFSFDVILHITDWRIYTRGRNLGLLFNPNNATQTHSIFVKL